LAVNQILLQVLHQNGDPDGFIPILTAYGYNEFVIVYNQVEQNIWFGHRSAIFTLTNNTQLIKNIFIEELCISKGEVPNDSQFGLPVYLGLNFCPVTSQRPTTEIIQFYYGDAQTQGDRGIWLKPNLSIPGSHVSYIMSKFKLNNMGPSHFYMEIDGLNMMDETQPFNFSTFNNTTNQTNGIVNSAFAKIPIVACPLQQYFDNGLQEYVKYFNPPAERIRRLKLKLRYHNGQLVEFDNFSFTFTLEFTMINPQMNRKLNLSQPFSY
jgi:hypothetical protein